jgi:hypothetical protein
MGRKVPAGPAEETLARSEPADLPVTRSELAEQPRAPMEPAELQGTRSGPAEQPRTRSGPAQLPRGDARRRSWLEIRWRQFRNAPRPVVRAVAASLVAAVVLGLLYLAYDVALTKGASLPGGDLRFGAAVLYVGLVLVVGSFVTWLIVPLPRGAAERGTRTAWSAALGLFAAIPIAYLVLVVAIQILKPLLV